MDFGANTEEPPFLFIFRPTGGFDWTDRFLARSEGVGDLSLSSNDTTVVEEASSVAPASSDSAWESES